MWNLTYLIENQQWDIAENNTLYLTQKSLDSNFALLPMKSVTDFSSESQVLPQTLGLFDSKTS